MSHYDAIARYIMPLPPPPPESSPEVLALAQKCCEASAQDASEFSASLIFSPSLLAAAAARLEVICMTVPSSKTAREELVQLLRMLRNCCTAGPQVHRALSRADIPAAAARATLHSWQGPEGADDRPAQLALTAAVQLMANLMGGSGSESPDSGVVAAVWSACTLEAGINGSVGSGSSPQTLLDLAARDTRPAVLGPMVALCLALTKSLPETSAALSTSLASVLQNLLEKVPTLGSESDSGALCRLVEVIAVRNGHLLPLIECIGSPPGPIDISAPTPDALTCSPALVTLMDALYDISHAALDLGTGREAEVDPDDVAAFLSLGFQSGLATAIHVAACQARREMGAEGDHAGDEAADLAAPHRVLEASLKVLRLCTSHDGATVGASEQSADPEVAARRRREAEGVDYREAWGEGLGPLGLAARLLAALKPIRNPRRELPPGPASDPPGFSLPHLKAACAGYPHRPVYKSYRTELVAVLANPPHRRPWLQDAMASLGLVEILLSHCQVDEESPLCREWALWAIRNLCEGNETVQTLIRDLKVEDVIETEEMRRTGMRVELDKATGKLRSVKVTEEDGKDSKRDTAGPSGPSTS